ncbi:MAG: hypothetical protein ACRCWI_04895 [Brevinema sp.]
MNRYILFFFLNIFSTIALYAQLKPGEFIEYSDIVKDSLQKDMVEPLDEYHSYINWSKGEIVTEYNIPITYSDRNIGRHNQNMSGQLRERILQFMTGAITKLRISSIFSLGNLFDQQQTIRLNILSILYDRPLENTIISNSSMYGQVSIPLFGTNSITQLLYQNIRPREITNYLQRETTGTQIYDTLIIDMVMFPYFKASLTPRILNTKGEILHSIETVDPQILLKQSAVHFVTSITEALAHPSLGKYISYTLPHSIDGALSADIVLFDEDVQKLFSQQRTINNLKKGNVIVIIPSSN